MASSDPQPQEVPMKAEPRKEHAWLQKFAGEWTFEGESSKARFSIQAPESLAVGSKFHIVCCYKSPRFQTGPACGPTTVIVGGGVPETNVG